MLYLQLQLQAYAWKSLNYSYNFQKLHPRSIISGTLRPNFGPNNHKLSGARSVLRVNIERQAILLAYADWAPLGVKISQLVQLKRDIRNPHITRMQGVKKIDSPWNHKIIETAF